VEQLVRAVPHVFVEIHPSMAFSYGINNGDRVRVKTRRGVVSASAKLTSAIRMDTLFMPFHFPGSGTANLLTNPALDPISRMPEFKVCAARIEKETPC
jgi:assimilatory nitrate reductase catalytic subunit